MYTWYFKTFRETLIFFKFYITFEPGKKCDFSFFQKNAEFWCLSSKFIHQFISNFACTVFYFVGICLDEAAWLFLRPFGMRFWSPNDTIQECFINWAKLVRDFKEYLVQRSFCEGHEKDKLINIGNRGRLFWNVKVAEG